MKPLVQVEGLRVVARNDAGVEFPIVSADFSINQGEVLALIGESGSGKTTIALSLMGYARNGCRIAGGSVRIGERQVLELDDAGLSGLRGRTVAYIAQSAASSFNPSRTLMDQVVESAAIHHTLTRAKAEAKAVELFRALALPDPEHIGARYPHQVSGGQLQRVMAAMAFITDPALVILDEPTTALDVTTQIEVLRAFRDVVRLLGTTAVYVSHDLAVVAQMADRIVVLRDGEIRENGATAQVLEAPAHDYTRCLLAAAEPVERDIGIAAPAPLRMPVPLLKICGLYAGYGPTGRDGLPAKRILTDADLTIERGATVGVIGESGSGKTTLARVVAGMVPSARGQVLLDDAPLPDCSHGRTREQHQRVQFVFQNADTALNPAHSIGAILARPLSFYLHLRGDARRRRAAAARPGQAAGGHRRPPAGRTVGRAETARQPGARAGGGAGPDPVRRNHVRARHRGRRRHPRPDGRTAARAEGVVHVHQPRHQHRARHLRRDRGAVRRAESRIAPARGVGRGALPSLHAFAGIVRAQAGNGLARYRLRARRRPSATPGAIVRGLRRRSVRLPAPLRRAHGRLVQPPAAAAPATGQWRRDSLSSHARRADPAASAPTTF